MSARDRFQAARTAADLRAAEVEAQVEAAEALNALVGLAEAWIARQDAKDADAAEAKAPRRRRPPSDSALSRSANRLTAVPGAVGVAVTLIDAGHYVVWVPSGQDPQEWAREYVLRIVHRSPRDIVAVETLPED